MELSSLAEIEMSGRLNWERARFNMKARMSVKAEADFMDRELASRWLERKEKQRSRWEALNKKSGQADSEKDEN
jgi:hypothetical protein